MTHPQPERPSTVYERVGGHDTFVTLVHEFYRGVAQDPPLRALYPEEDLGPAEVRFRMFLEQYWGGPTTYSEQRGHPRLRMRHMPFRVTPTQRDRWLHHMNAALDTVSDRMDSLDEQQMRAYMAHAAQAMVNVLED
ncbi:MULTISPECIES: globin [unclassified Serinicoccus]|uniref:globin n=1 Tax=unclassified Serinicoccus TaxID=2643101 RepID=UPI003852CA9E